MSEARLTEQVRQLLKDYKVGRRPHFFYWKVSDRFTAGIPDWYVLIKGNALHIELKAPGLKADPLQEHMINKINLAGGYAICSDNFDEVKGLIDTFI